MADNDGDDGALHQNNNYFKLYKMSDMRMWSFSTSTESKRQSACVGVGVNNKMVQLDRTETDWWIEVDGGLDGGKIMDNRISN